MKKNTSFFKSPLFHFFILGGLLFVAYSWLNPESEERNDLIVIDQAQIKYLSELQAKRLNRTPTADEIKGLIDDYVITEIYYREGVKLGLDKNDHMIKKRVRNKIEMISNDVVSLLDINDTLLEQYLEAHADKFAIEAEYSFDQIYVNPQNYGSDLKKYLREVKKALDTTGEAQTDSLMLPRHYQRAGTSRIDAEFGKDFSKHLTNLTLGEWSGPFQSGYGQHFIKLTEKRPSKTVQLEDVRESVLREYLAQKREEMLQNQRKELLKKYEVVIDMGTETLQEGDTQ